MDTLRYEFSASTPVRIDGETGAYVNGITLKIKQKKKKGLLIKHMSGKRNYYPYEIGNESFKKAIEFGLVYAHKVLDEKSIYKNIEIKVVNCALTHDTFNMPTLVYTTIYAFWKMINYEPSMRVKPMIDWINQELYFPKAESQKIPLHYSCNESFDFIV